MAASIAAQVNPPLLVWAREQSGYEPAWVARRLRVTAERLLAWEQGERRPTVRQTQKLASLYRRPFGVFFLPQPPVLPPPAAEYRRLPGVEPGAESPELRLALRVMSQRREIAIDLLGELGTPIAEFAATAYLSEGAYEVGRRLRALLGVTVQEQFGWSSEWQAWQHWRAAVEVAGVLVLQFPRVPVSQVRGVSLLKFPLPAIGLNSKETVPGARVFTLLHELVHVALAAGREEQAAIQETRSETAWSRVERFAEEAASEALIPDDAFKTFVRRMSVGRDQWDVALVRRLAGKFRVTPLAMATRLRVAGALTWDGYHRWRSAWNTYVETLRPRTGGFASPVDKALGRSGRPFVQLVVGALDANRITSVQASRYLDLRFDHFDALRSMLRLGARSTATIDDGA